jgi:hypothetical protein
VSDGSWRGKLGPMSEDERERFPTLTQPRRLLRKVRPLALDAFYPGHFTFSVQNGERHIERANECSTAC